MDIKAIKQEIMELPPEPRALLFHELQFCLGVSIEMDEKTRIDRHWSSDREHDRVRSELKALRQENELLLLQLHQVQEELELYFLANQEMIAALKQSRQALNQSRSILFNLPQKMRRGQETHRT